MPLHSEFQVYTEAGWVPVARKPDKILGWLLSGRTFLTTEWSSLLQSVEPIIYKDPTFLHPLYGKFHPEHNLVYTCIQPNNPRIHIFNYHVIPFESLISITPKPENMYMPMEQFIQTSDNQWIATIVLTRIDAQYGSYGETITDTFFKPFKDATLYYVKYNHCIYLTCG